MKKWDGDHFCWMQRGREKEEKDAEIQDEGRTEEEGGLCWGEIEFGYIWFLSPSFDRISWDLTTGLE